MKTAKEFLKQKGIREIKNIGTGKMTNQYAVTPDLMEAYAQDKVGVVCPECGCNKYSIVEDEYWCLNKNCGYEWKQLKSK